MASQYDLPYTGPQVETLLAKISELESEMPSKTSDLTNDSGFITSADVPTKTSDLNNDSGFITNAPVAAEAARAQAAEALLATISSLQAEISRATGVEGTLQDLIDGIAAKIPSAATEQNQLADKSYVNASIATASATFRGTYISLVALQAVAADENDYGYVISTDSVGNTIYNRYKYANSTWTFEYAIANPVFDSSQWAAINSAVTAELVAKLSALPDNATLTAALAAKQDVIDDLSSIRSKANSAYQKPSGGIPASDIADGVIPDVSGKVNTSDIADNLTTNDATKVLSAKQGKVLSEQVSQLGQEMDLIGEFSTIESPNLFDKTTATAGYGVRSDNGNLYAKDDTTVSDYIPIPSGAGSMYLTKVRASGALYWAAYDSSKNFTHGTNSKSVTIQTGDAYIRFCCKTTDVDVAMAIVGTESDVPSEYMPFGNIPIGGLKDGIVTTPKMADGAVENSKVIDRAITIPKADFLKSTNLLDKNATDVELGKYININTGALASNASYNTSGYIRVVAGEIIYFGSIEQNAYANFYAFYSKDKTFISGGVGDAGNVTVPNGAYYLRFTLSTAKWNDKRAQATIGQRFPYSVFHYMLDGSISLGSSILPCETSLGTGAEKATAASISDGGAVTIDTFPRYQLKGMVMSFSCNLTTFGSLIIGKGYQQSLGEYIRISSSNVETVWCNLSGVETVSDTSAHGLTITSFLRVSIFYTSEAKMKYVITTASGSFTKEIYWKYIGENPAFVRSDGTAATDVVLSIGSQDLKKPVWAFGDSYMSIENSRWVGVMRNIGVFDFMVNALSGINSTNMITDAFKAFAYGSPKFAIWGLGMNDGSDADAQTPNPAWLTAITSFINLCEGKNTIPILATIPCVPSKNHEGKNAWVKASGYRYIDFAKAVNGETYSSGVNTWYDGMLSSDNVHPTSIGAQALAAQVMVDFPEIMQ